MNNQTDRQQNLAANLNRFNSLVNDPEGRAVALLRISEMVETLVSIPEPCLEQLLAATDALSEQADKLGIDDLLKSAPQTLRDIVKIGREVEEKNTATIRAFLKVRPSLIATFRATEIIADIPND